MRIAIAHIGQETGSFAPTPTTIDTFRSFGLYAGNELLEKMRNVGPIGGFGGSRRGKTCVYPLPVVRAWGGAHGPLTADTHFLEEKLVTGLQRVLPVDGFFFTQHGAAAADNDPDVEGYILAALRRVLGPNVPIVCPWTTTVM